MIELKEAVSKSLDALKEMNLVPPATSIELEEAELKDDGTVWTVTFSYPDPTSAVDPDEIGPNLAAILRNKRAYKAIRLLASNGSIRGIKSVHV